LLLHFYVKDDAVHCVCKGLNGVPATFRGQDFVLVRKDAAQASTDRFVIVHYEDQRLWFVTETVFFGFKILEEISKFCHFLHHNQPRTHTD